MDYLIIFLFGVFAGALCSMILIMEITKEKN